MMVLTEKQKRFVQEHIIDLNAMQKSGKDSKQLHGIVDRLP